jgi:hypothetical protein
MNALLTLSDDRSRGDRRRIFLSNSRSFTAVPPSVVRSVVRPSGIPVPWSRLGRARDIVVREPVDLVERPLALSQLQRPEFELDLQQQLAELHSSLSLPIAVIGFDDRHGVQPNRAGGRYDKGGER